MILRYPRILRENLTDSKLSRPSVYKGANNSSRYNKTLIEARVLQILVLYEGVDLLLLYTAGATLYGNPMQ